MALDLSGLSAYSDQMKFDLIAQSITEAKTAKMIDIQEGIKHTAPLNYLNTDIVMQAGGSCNTTPSGTTTLTQKNITVCRITINEDICLDDLENFWTGMKMKGGSYNTDIPFHELFATTKVAKLALENDLLIWQGDTAPGSPAPANTNLLRCDGLLKHLDTDGGYINGNPTAITSGTGVTVSNVRGIVDGMVNLIPENIAYRDDLVIFTNISIYRTYTLALRNANLFNNAGENSDMECMIQGTNVKLVANPGLAGKNVLVCSWLGNFVYGTDLLSDSDSFKMFWSEYDEKLKVRIHYKLGTQIRFNSEVVYFKLV